MDKRRCELRLKILLPLAFSVFSFVSPASGEYFDPLQFSLPQKASLTSSNYEHLFVAPELPPQSTPEPVPQKKEEPDTTVVETLILEAVGDGYDAMVAVGEVIRNRAKLFNTSYREVCLMPYQFSGWNDAKRAKEFLKVHKRFYEMAEEAWKESETTHLTQNATDYHAYYVQPYWAAGYRRTVRLGAHIFYCRK